MSQNEAIHVTPGLHSVGSCSTKLPTGRYTQSLAEIFAQMLREAQDYYGPRDKSFSYVGFLFSGPNPRVIHYQSGSPGDVIIILSDAAALDMRRACFELSHEVVHLLSPATPETVTVFEEGLATTFMNLLNRRNKWSSIETIEAYTSAANLVQTIIDNEPDIVSSLRRTKPRFSDWSADDLAQRLGNRVPYSDLKNLCQPFKNWIANFS